MKITLQLHINDILEQVQNTEGIWLEGIVKAEIEYSVTWNNDGAEVEIKNIEISWPEQDVFTVWKILQPKTRIVGKNMFEKEFWEMFKNGRLDLGTREDCHD